MKNITGVETITTKNSTGTLTLNNVATSTVGFGFEGNSTNDIAANHVAGALAGTNDILNVNLNGAKDVKLTVAAGFESAKITTAGSSSIDTLTAPGVATYTVEGTGSVDFKNNLANVTTLSATNNSGAITATVDATTGYATKEIQAGTNGATVLLGAGNDNIGFKANAAKASTVKLGAGDDKLSLTTDTVGTYVFGEAGNDTIKAVNALSAKDLIDGGEGTDTLVLAAAANTMVLRGVEKLTLTNTATGANVINSADSAIAVTVEAGTGATAMAGLALTGLTSGSTVTINDAKDATGGIDTNTIIGFKSAEAATTLDINSVVANSSANDLEVTNVTNLTVDTAKDAVFNNTKLSGATDVTFKAAAQIETGVISDEATNDTLKNVTVSSTSTSTGDTVTVGNITATTLETVNVSGVKEVKLGTTTNSTKLSSVTVSSSDDKATADNIGSATVTKLNTVSVTGKLATEAKTVDALEIGTITVTSSTDNAKLGNVSSAAAVAKIGNITVSGAKGASIGTVGNASNDTLSDISVTATNGQLVQGAILAKELGTVTLTSTAKDIKGDNITANDTSGITVNYTAKTAIDTDGDGADATALVVQNTDGNITASVAGATKAAINFTAVKNTASAIVNLTATNTGGLTSTVTNASTIADALTSTITLGNAVTNEKNDVAIKGTVATLNVTGGTGVDNIVLNDAQVKSGTIALGTGTDSVNFDQIISATSTSDAAGVVINLGSTAYKIDDGETYATSVAAGHAVEYNAAAGATAKKLVTDGFDLTLSGVEKVTGTAGADIIIANAAGSTITGGAGADTIILNAGKDTVVFGASATDLVTYAGTDTNTAKIEKVTNFNITDDTFQLTNGTSFAGITLLATTGFTVNEGAAAPYAIAAGAANITALTALMETDATGVASTDGVAAAATGIQAYTFTTAAGTGAFDGKTYLVINDSTAPLAATDVIIDITGVTGNISAADFVIA